MCVGHNFRVVAAGTEFWDADDTLRIVAECPTLLGETRFRHLVAQQPERHLQVLRAGHRTSLAGLLETALAALFDRSHLAGIVVIVRQRQIDVAHVQ